MDVPENNCKHASLLIVENAKPNLKLIILEYDST